MKDRLLDVLKGAVEVNLRYSSIALNISKEYVKEFNRVVRDRVAAKLDPAEAKPVSVRRQPILLVGQLNEQATGAFVLNNTSGTELNVSLAVQGELSPTQVQLVPSSFVLASGESGVVRLKVILADALEEGRDYSGAICAPGLSAQAIDFVVRRLPDGAGAEPPREGKAPSNRAAV
jgi:hypothetical protein